MLRSWDTHSGVMVFECTRGEIYHHVHTRDIRYHAGNGNGKLILLDTQTDQEWTFDEPNVVDELEFSPNDRFMIAQSKKQETVTVLDVERRRVATRADAQKATMSKEGDLFFTQKKPQAPVVVWDLSENQKVGELPVSLDHWIISPNGQLLLEWHFGKQGEDGTIDVWDVRATKRRFHRASKNVELIRVCFSPDSRRLALWSLGIDTEMEVIDTATGKLLWSEPKIAMRCFFSPDSSVFLDLHPGLPIHDANTGNHLWSRPRWKFIDFVSDTNMAIFLDPDSDFFHFVDVHTGKTNATLPPRFAGASPVISGNGKYLVATGKRSRGREPRLWEEWLDKHWPTLFNEGAPAVLVMETATGRKLFESAPCDGFALLSADGNTLVTVDSVPGRERESHIRIWDVHPTKAWLWTIGVALVAALMWVIVLGAIRALRKRRERQRLTYSA
jgi:WD40 repeat protein